MVPVMSFLLVRHQYWTICLTSVLSEYSYHQSVDIDISLNIQTSTSWETRRQLWITKVHKRQESNVLDVMNECNSRKEERKLKRNFVSSLHHRATEEQHHAVIHYSTGNTNKEYFVFSLLFKSRLSRLHCELYNLSRRKFG